MPNFRFTLVTLLAAVAFVAYAIAGVTNADPVWVSFTFSFSVFALLVSALGAIYDQDDRRSFWVGFLIFGCCYLMLSFGPWFSSNFRPNLITSRLAMFIHTYVRRIEAPGPSATVVYLDGNGRVFVNEKQILPEQIPTILGTTPRESVYVYEDDPKINSGEKFVDARREFWTALSKATYIQQNTAIAATVMFPRRETLDAMVHSLFIFIVAVIGGMIAQQVRRERQVLSTEDP